MNERQAAFAEFLGHSGCDLATSRALKGDASARSYVRISLNGKPVIGMNAPPESGQDVGAFVRIAEWLSEIGLSAPNIIFTDFEQGFLLLEDLGDDVFAKVIPKQVSGHELYCAAVDVLGHWQLRSPPELPRYDTRKLVDLVAETQPFYASLFGGEQSSDLTAQLFRVLAPLEHRPKVFAHRDYHVENLIWLPDRSGVARVGLLDFQDAFIGHPAYALASILYDARRDVEKDLQIDMLSRFKSLIGANDAFKAEFWATSLQRNLRILGVFARLVTQDDKPGYAQFVPRVWSHVVRALDEMEDPQLRDTVLAHFPNPAKLDRS